MAKKTTVVPTHVAVIMDGNGRWAKKRLLPRSAGHAKGCDTLEQICEDAWDLGIKYFTVYAFSTENWKRSESEISTLMNIFRKYLVDSLEKCRKNNMKVRVIGDMTRLAPDIQEKINILTEASKDYTGLNLQVALNYGGRDEIVRAVKHVSEDVAAGKLDADSITEDVFNSYLDTREVPYPDLLIRTSGELRTSNFLPWQLAYSEFYFTDVLWPDFDKAELQKAIDYYNNRDRRFGGVKA